MAREVAAGHIELNKALHQLMRREKAERIIRQFELPRSSAFNVAQGTQSIEDALLAKEIDESEANQPQRTLLGDLKESGAQATFFLFDEEPFRAEVAGDTTFDVTLRPEGAEERTFPKHLIRFVAPDLDAEALSPLLAVDEEVAGKALGASTSYKDRFRGSKRQLFLLNRDAAPARVVLRDGTALTGYVGWFSKWEFELGLVRPVKGKRAPAKKPQGSVVVFRHALDSIESIG